MKIDCVHFGRANDYQTCPCLLIGVLANIESCFKKLDLIDYTLFSALVTGEIPTCLCRVMLLRFAAKGSAEINPAPAAAAVALVFHTRRNPQKDRN